MILPYTGDTNNMPDLRWKPTNSPFKNIWAAVEKKWMKSVGTKHLINWNWFHLKPF